MYNLLPKFNGKFEVKNEVTYMLDKSGEVVKYEMPTTLTFIRT